jgi:thioesterase domain-containing protein
MAEAPLAVPPIGPGELADYLHQHIPLSAAMQVAVEAVTPQTVVLRAPLAPNINHRDTVFGGSASALAILAAWSLLHTRMRAAGLTAKLVIHRNSMDYGAPILGEFSASSSLDEADWQTFTRMFARKGKARISVRSMLQYQGAQAGHLVGEFVALQ